MLDLVDGHHRPVGRRNDQSRLDRDAPRRVAEEPHDQDADYREGCNDQPARDFQGGRDLGDGEPGGQAGAGPEGEQAKDEQLGQAGASERDAVPPAERVVLWVPVVATLVAVELQVAWVEDLVRAAVEVALPAGGHPADIAGP
jgi:hypothetical protein